MKIESVEPIRIGTSILVQITTDSGLTGIGQSACWGYPDASATLLSTFAGHLVGEDPLRIEHHWQRLYRMGPFRGSVLSGAVSAVDIALWDIKGKHYGAPVWDLLGGKVRDRIRLHLLMGGNTPEQVDSRTREAVEDGFTAIKFDPLPPGYFDMSLDRVVKTVVENVAAAREAGGPDVEVILELHRKLTPMVSVALSAKLAEFNPMFIEDPIQIDSIQSQTEIARRIDSPLANGERLHNIWEFRELLESGGPQYIRPDLGLAGGLTQCKKIAAVVESYHSAVVTHNYLGPVLTAASVHLDASIPNFIVQEYSKADESEASRVYKSQLRRTGGYLNVPDGSGLGVELDAAALDGISTADPPLDLPLRNDGSVAFSV